MLKPLLTISRDSLIYNYNIFAAINNVAPVLKANAYSCGVDNIAPLLPADSYFVFSLAEAIELRRFKQHATIYVLENYNHGYDDDYTYYNIIPTINRVDDLASIYKRDINYIIAVDTGMNRLGIHHDMVASLYANAPEYWHKAKAVISHLSHGDSPDDGYNIIQMNNFKQMQHGVANIQRWSLSASAGSFLAVNNPNYPKEDFTRVGVGLYGPFMANAPYELRNAINLCAPILQIRHVKKGEHIGYGEYYRASHDMRILIAGIGYGDGLSRHYSGKFNALLGGQSIPSIARISMDSCFFDITHIKHDITENFISLLHDNYNAYNFACAVGTTTHELLTTWQNRVEYLVQ